MERLSGDGVSAHHRGLFHGSELGSGWLFAFSISVGTHSGSSLAFGRRLHIVIRHHEIYGTSSGNQIQ